MKRLKTNQDLFLQKTNDIVRKRPYEDSVLLTPRVSPAAVKHKAVSCWKNSPAPFSIERQAPTTAAKWTHHTSHVTLRTSLGPAALIREIQPKAKERWQVSYQTLSSQNIGSYCVIWHFRKLHFLLSRKWSQEKYGLVFNKALSGLEKETTTSR